jgi:outer membrane protein assembly factor BamB
MPAVGTVAGRKILVYLDEIGGSAAAGQGTPSATASPTAQSSPGQKQAQTSLVGVDLRGRKELWRTPLKTTSRSGVAVDGANAFVADDDGNVYAVDLAKGTLRWTQSTIGEVLSPPAISEGRVYVAAHDTKDQRSQLVALDEQTGKPAWEFSSPVSGSTGSGAAAAAGAVLGGFADRMVRSLTPGEGNERWGTLALSVFSPASAPALEPHDVYIADVSGGLYRLSAETGARDWDYQLNELVVRSSPVLSGTSVLLGLNDGRLVAVDSASGHLVWEGATGPGLIGAIALSPELAVAVKGGRHAGLVAFKHDPAGSLVDVASPTVVDPADLYGHYAVGLAIAFVLLFVPFRILARRIGPPRFGVDEEEREDEEEDDTE